MGHGLAEIPNHYALTAALSAPGENCNCSPRRYYLLGKSDIRALSSLHIQGSYSCHISLLIGEKKKKKKKKEVAMLIIPPPSGSNGTDGKMSSARQEAECCAGLGNQLFPVFWYV